MNHTIIKNVVGGLAIAAVALGSAVPAIAATGTVHRAVAHAAAAGPTGSLGGPTVNGTLLTGSTLTSASASAVAAVPDGTVIFGSTAPAGSNTQDAAYQVHISKADGGRVIVLEDASFSVLGTMADGGGGPGGSGGPGASSSTSPSA